MRLATDNLIEAFDTAGRGMDLRAWSSGYFDPTSPHANLGFIVDATFSYDAWGDPDFLSLEFSDGSSAGYLLETDSFGIYATSQSSFAPSWDVVMTSFVGYGLSTAPGAPLTSASSDQFFLWWSEVEAIADGWASFPLCTFSLAGHDEIYGNRYSDNIVGARGNDMLFGQGGNDQLSGGGGHDFLAGGFGKDRLKGGGGNDWLSGGNGVDQLYGGSGPDTLQGGRGDDMLFGNGSADRFVFRRGDGDDVIEDFHPGRDVIEIDSGANRFKQLDISRDGSDTLIEFANVSITLDGIKPGEIDADDFIF